MPGLDKTGPDGQGSKTGRGLGRCNPDFKEDSFGDSANNAGIYFGRGRGRNRGWRSGRS